MEQHNPQTEDRGNLASIVMMLVLRGFALSLEVVLHRRFGSRGIGVPALVAFFAIPFWAALWPHESPRPLLGLWVVFVVMCVSARLGVAMRGRKVYAEHSRYNGWPRLKFLCPWCSENTFKRVVEPILMFLVGGLLLAVNPPLGSYIMMAAWAMAGSMGLIEAAEHAQAQDLNDQWLAQQQAMERFRRMRGE